MKKKIIWLVVSCLMVLSLVLAACAKPAAAPPAKEEVAPPAKEVAPPKKEEVAPPKVAEKVAPPQAELVKVTLTKNDGTKMVLEKEKPKYGGVLRRGAIGGVSEFSPLLTWGGAINCLD